MRKNTLEKEVMFHLEDKDNEPINFSVLCEESFAVVKETQKTIIYDLSSLTYISSRVIGIFAGVYRELNAKQERNMAIVNFNSFVGDSIAQCGLFNLPIMYKTLDDYLISSKK
ncbi:MAG: STAS domain-containing protein [Candidatus Woesearchaeota archaeon]|jgi:anti-anti-sigma factor